MCIRNCMPYIIALIVEILLSTSAYIWCGNMFRWHSFPTICYPNIIQVRKISLIEILLFGKWLMVVLSIDHGKGIPGNRFGGLFIVCQSSPTAAAHLFLYT